MDAKEAKELLSTMGHAESFSFSFPDCDCEYCLSDRLHAIDKAKFIKEQLIEMGWMPPKDSDAINRDSAEKFQDSVFKVLAAVREYLPPDGIGKDEFISRVIEAVDNPDFNSALYTNSREDGEFGEGATVRRAPEHG